jgi:hypothetical protein
MSEKNLKKEVLLNLLLNRFQFLSDSDNAVEAKANALLGFSVTICLVFLVEKFPKILTVYKQIEAGLGIVFLVVSISITIFGILKSRKYGSGVVEKNKIKERLQFTDEKFLNESIVDLQQSIESNSQILKEKTRAFKFSMISFTIGVCLLALSSFSTICL